MPIIDFEQLFFIADNLRNNARVDEAIAAYKEIAGLCTEPDDARHQAHAWHMAGVSAEESVLEEGSYYRDAQGYFDQAEKLFRAVNDQESLGALQRDRAIIADYAGKNSDAENWFQKSLATLSAINNQVELGISQVKFGLHYYKKGDYSTAQKYMSAGLLLLEQEPSAGFYRATGLYDLARVKTKLRSFDEALESATTSLSWFEADHGGFEHQRRIAQLHGLLFVLYYRLGNQALAKKNGEKYQQLLKTFDPLAAQVIEKDLEMLAAN